MKEINEELKVDDKTQIVGEDQVIDTGNTTVILTDKTDHILLAIGPDVPDDAQDGFAVGCIFINSFGGNNQTVYINEGTTDSCDFNALKPDYLIVDKISLTSDQVKALRTTPITLVAAPGANKLIQFDSAVLRLNYGGTNAFTESADNLAIKYNNGSGVAVSETIETTGWIDQTTNTYTQTHAVKDAIVAASGNVNKPLVLHNIGDDEIAGNAAKDNTVDIWITYRILSV